MCHVALFTITKLSGGLDFNMLVKSHHINLLCYCPFPSSFLEDLWIWKDNFPFFRSKNKRIKGIQKKDQDSGALIKPLLSVNNLNLGGKKVVHRHTFRPTQGWPIQEQLMFVEHLLYARHWVFLMDYLIKFYLYAYDMVCFVCFLLAFTGGSEAQRLTILPKGTQLINGATEIWTLAVWLQSQTHNH